MGPPGRQRKCSSTVPAIVRYKMSGRANRIKAVIPVYKATAINVEKRHQIFWFLEVAFLWELLLLDSGGGVPRRNGYGTSVTLAAID
jgi:hypothetical protein